MPRFNLCILAGAAILLYFGCYLTNSTEISIEKSTWKDPNHELKPGPFSSNHLTGKFGILGIPETTDWLVSNFTEEAREYYATALYEEQAEIWLDRALHKASLSTSTWTEDLDEAELILIPSYLHLNAYLGDRMEYSNPKKIAELILNKLLVNPHDIGKPHVLLVPSWNPAVSSSIGIAAIMQTLQSNGFNMYSVGFERNPGWQQVTPDRIIPVPYVVKPSQEYSHQDLANILLDTREENFVFYAGDRREHAVQWGGCDRSMLLPLTNRTDMFVRIVGKQDRLSQEEYNHYLYRSDYCLVVCGDTPTSRSLASAMLLGCIPIRIGSRLRGYCDPPCHKGWGWRVTNLSHLPYSERIDWSIFPEVDEAEFAADPESTLQNSVFAQYSSQDKKNLREIMKNMQLAWLYGLGDPVSSDDFGEAATNILESIFDNVGV